MRMRRRQREVLQNAHRDAREHSDQQNHDAHAHHQRSDHLKFLVLRRGASRRAERRVKSRAGPRLCDLMSRKGLAYLSLGIEIAERFNARQCRGGEGFLSMEDFARALADFVRDHQVWAAPIVLRAGVRRVARLPVAAGPGLGGAGRDRRADRRQRHQLLAGLAGRRAGRRAWRLGLLLVRLQIQGAGRARCGRCRATRRYCRAAKPL